MTKGILTNDQVALLSEGDKIKLLEQEDGPFYGNIGDIGYIDYIVKDDIHVCWTDTEKDHNQVIVGEWKVEVLEEADEINTEETCEDEFEETDFMGTSVNYEIQHVGEPVFHSQNKQDNMAFAYNFRKDIPDKIKEALGTKDKKLAEGGLLDEDLALTDLGQTELLEIVLEEHKDEMVEVAEEIIEEREEDEE